MPGYRFIYGAAGDAVRCQPPAIIARLKIDAVDLPGGWALPAIAILSRSQAPAGKPLILNPLVSSQTAARGFWRPEPPLGEVYPPLPFTF